MAHLVAIVGHLLCAALARLILAIKLHLITANAVVRQREKGERERERVGARKVPGNCIFCPWWSFIVVRIFELIKPIAIVAVRCVLPPSAAAAAINFQFSVSVSVSVFSWKMQNWNYIAAWHIIKMQRTARNGREHLLAQAACQSRNFKYSTCSTCNTFHQHNTVRPNWGFPAVRSEQDLCLAHSANVSRCFLSGLSEININRKWARPTRRSVQKQTINNNSEQNTAQQKSGTCCKLVPNMRNRHRCGVDRARKKKR